MDCAIAAEHFIIIASIMLKLILIIELGIMTHPQPLPVPDKIGDREGLGEGQK